MVWAAQITHIEILKSLLLFRYTYTLLLLIRWFLV